MDYNIYIHSDTKTTPRTQIDTTTDNDTSPSESIDLKQGLSQVVGMAQNPIGSSIGLLTKAVPIVASIVAVGTMAYKVVDTTCKYVFTKTGNVSDARALNNFNASIGVLFNPVGAITNVIDINMQNDIANAKTEQQRLLVGNSITNSSDIGAN